LTNKKNDSWLNPSQPQAAYLIRCWREAEMWRYSVEDVALRRRWRYDSLEKLLAALRERMPHPNADTLKK